MASAWMTHAVASAFVDPYATQRTDCAPGMTAMVLRVRGNRLPGWRMRSDIPCAYIQCPAGTHCFMGACTDRTPGTAPQLRPEPDAAVPVLDSGIPDAQSTADALQGDVRRFTNTPVASSDTGDTGGCDCSALAGSPNGSWFWVLIITAFFRCCRRQKS